MTALPTEHAVVRNELFQHRETIMEKFKQLPGCAHFEVSGPNLRENLGRSA
ncbi:MAG: hypothetical protein HYV75_03745 [Opitutae bacterium]|nr:hypothetical protein [Opitutae bacterium]